MADPQTAAGAAEADTNLTTTNGHPSNPNKFQQAISAWRALSFTTLISTLDTTASDLVTHQQDSLVQRKDLAQKTKEFRKLEDGAKLGEIKDLLKAYQSYIDSLSTHSKSVQAAFLQVYGGLSEVPDPYPLLEASVEALVTADEVVPQLEGENERLQGQVSTLNEQLEVAEKDLEQERTKRQLIEAEQDARVKEVEGRWSKVLEEKEENWSSKELLFSEKLENQDRLLKELKASYEVSQRLERSGEDTQQDVGSTATQAELDILTSELERSNVRLADLESRNEALRIELAQNASQTHTSSSRSMVVEDDPAFLRLRSENQSLLRRFETARYEKEAEKSGIEGKLRSLEREIGALKVDREGLLGKVRKWSDYEEVKRELEMLRAIEFATASSDDDDVADAADAGAEERGAAQSTDSLEKLLLARNKKLSNDFTELRVSHSSLLQRLEQLQEDLSNTNMDLEKTRTLNATLENDLQKTQQEASNAFETMSVAGTYTSRFPAKSAYGSRRGQGGWTSPTSSIIGGLDPSSGSGSPRGGGGGGTLDSLRAGEALGGAGGGILPMVTAQRDRFKRKIGELEQELQKQYQAVAALRSEVASLQRDNLNLYEKTRYVSTYNSAHSRGQQPASMATSGVSYGNNPNPSTISVGSPVGGGGGEERYRSAYEQGLSPFAAFRGRESARAMKRMSLPERAVFQLTRLVLATRTSRNLFAMYCVGLHLLVFIMLFWAGGGEARPLGAVAGAAVVGGGAGTGKWRQEGLEGLEGGG
ncbi:hypothetical protein LTR56_005457 [Elasticomyces elasticus]|nr:hypothetical protein LTR56_005457 [Elasticomyces elasticus]KAK3665419.1 hypothetical protein LTR22_003649 [Elasticomyces elasticus]KAK4929937.1 hypothetical protein LTR49_003564 [Elasticomyces elasticus]KAK5769253.1 hypothetical protein LTS12_000604 [Elasticomyces elasticus]